MVDCLKINCVVILRDFHEKMDWNRTLLAFSNYVDEKCDEKFVVVNFAGEQRALNSLSSDDKIVYLQHILSAHSIIQSHNVLLVAHSFADMKKEIHSVSNRLISRKGDLDIGFSPDLLASFMIKVIPPGRTKEYDLARIGEGFKTASRATNWFKMDMLIRFIVRMTVPFTTAMKMSGTRSSTSFETIPEGFVNCLKEIVRIVAGFDDDIFNYMRAQISCRVWNVLRRYFERCRASGKKFDGTIPLWYSKSECDELRATNEEVDEVDESNEGTSENQTNQQSPKLRKREDGDQQSGDDYGHSISNSPSPMRPSNRGEGINSMKYLSPISGRVHKRMTDERSHIKHELTETKKKRKELKEQLKNNKRMNESAEKIRVGENALESMERDGLSVSSIGSGFVKRR